MILNERQGEMITRRAALYGTKMRRWGGEQLYKTWLHGKGQTYLPPMDVALGSKKAFVASANFCEGLCDEIGLGKVISVTENVSKSKRVGGD